MDFVGMEFLIGKLVSILENEISLTGGVYDELDELRRELSSMRSFLEDAERNSGLSQVEKVWVQDVRDLCYPVEDIIDEFVYHMNKSKRGNKLTKYLYQAIFFPVNLWMRHRVSSQLQEINRKIKSIPERRQRYGLENLKKTKPEDELRRVQYRGESIVFAKDIHLVGIEDDRRQLIHWVTSDEPGRTVISVVGMGGSGKSTLVVNVYNSNIVKQQFDCYAWITVSQNYVLDDVLRDLIREFYRSKKEKVPMDLSSMKHKDLLEMLVNYLHPKRYVVVLDDVWSLKLWDDINVALLDEGLGSRVMLTTRSTKVAQSAFGVRSHVLHIKPLKLSEAWHLFCMKAFSSNENNSCPIDLQNIALDLVKKCGGLPLAVLALGGAMHSKQLVSEWIYFNNSLNQELSNNPDLEVVKSILWLSFTDLPYHLKSCFLYCSIFPEDYVIRRKRLIRLWIAEGFVNHVRGKSLERLADDYLMELIQRHMLQVAMRSPAGRPKACKVHDLLRELALHTSEREKLCTVYDGRESNEKITRERRLSILTSGKDVNSLMAMSKLRSLFIFTPDAITPSSASTFLSQFKFLKVLDLQDVPVEKLPNGIAHLFNLRYLNLRRTKVKELPKSIGKLQNSQTLDVADSNIELLPKSIQSLQNLRHLILYRYYPDGDDFYYIYGTPLPSSICKLANLQVLTGVDATPSLLKRLQNMTQLTSLAITKVRKVDEKDLCTSIQSMNLLENLFVMVTDEQEYLGIHALSTAPPCLKRLILVGKLDKVPCWFNSLHNLSYLCLHWSRLSEDLLQHIQSLANLGQLELTNVYAGDRLWFSTGFRKLTRLYLRNLPNLKEIIIEKGVMPGLQQMHLGNCKELKMLPRGIENLSSLAKVDLLLLSDELIDRIRGVDSVDHPRVQHIPEIDHFYQSTYGQSYESLSHFDFKKVSHVGTLVLLLLI
ncbi:hypothetical protein RJ639_003229 [Escallonia herrerae]|uniref:Disease resistance protein RPM1-like n=1 Tax=Escallonia herrerae TaxID=1293975 RepID=A0AA88VYZ5_9ASTE|nr:hypothetical protein RJ639_003229 [Escallonia herrerae]